MNIETIKNSMFPQMTKTAGFWSKLFGRGDDAAKAVNAAGDTARAVNRVGAGADLGRLLRPNKPASGLKLAPGLVKKQPPKNLGNTIYDFVDKTRPSQADDLIRNLNATAEHGPFSFDLWEQARNNGRRRNAAAVRLAGGDVTKANNLGYKEKLLGTEKSNRLWDANWVDEMAASKVLGPEWAKSVVRPQSGKLTPTDWEKYYQKLTKTNPNYEFLQGRPLMNWSDVGNVRQNLIDDKIKALDPVQLGGPKRKILNFGFDPWLQSSAPAKLK